MMNDAYRLCLPTLCQIQCIFYLFAHQSITRLVAEKLALSNVQTPCVNVRYVDAPLILHDSCISLLVTSGI